MQTFTGSDASGDSTTTANSRVERFEQPIEFSWSTFSAAADDAGMSHRYGGIHFASGDLVGRRLGREVGKRAWQKAQAFWQGQAKPVANLDWQLQRFVTVNNFDQLFRHS